MSTRNMFDNIQTNTTRDNSIYKINPAFWATRPVTKKMMNWASSDVDKLFDLSSKQLKGIHPVTKSFAEDKASLWLAICKMKITTGLTVNRPGSFFGRGGANIRSLSKQTDTYIYQDHSKMWHVYYWDKASLDAVKRSMAA